MFKRISVVLLVAALMLSVGGQVFANTVHLDQILGVSDYSADYLEGLDDALTRYFFQIGVLESEEVDLAATVDWQQFDQLYTRALPGYELAEELQWAEELDFAQAFAQIIKAIDQEEFVYTYGDELSQSEKFMAAAAVLGFTGVTDHAAQPDLESVLTMLLVARSDLGLYTPYLGHIDDQDIFRLSRAKKASLNKDQFIAAVPQLFELGVKGLEGTAGGIFTGYNVKNYNENPIFSTTHKIRYDHGDMGHMLQMISLLRREGINARWDVKARISSYVHHSDKWGEPNPDSVTATIDENRVVVSSASYDLLIEFATLEEQESFKAILDEHARRKEEDTYGLIRAPYYAPLYAASVPLPGYEEVIDFRVNYQGYYLQSYVLVDYFDEVLETMEGYVEEMGGDATIEYSTYYVNPEFTAYLENNLSY